MNAQIDSFQTCPDLGCATSPESRRVVFLVNVVQKSTSGLQNGGSTQQNRSFHRGETLVFTKRPVQLTVWSPFRGGGSGSKTAVQHGAVALFDPPPAPRRSTSPRSRGVKFDLPDKAAKRSIERTVLWEMCVSLQRNDRFGGPNRRVWPPARPPFGASRVHRPRASI